MANLNDQIRKINEQVKQLQALLIEIFSSEFAKEKIKNFREHTVSEGNPLF